MAGNVISFNQESVLANDSDGQEEITEEISSTTTSLVEKLNLVTEKKVLVLDLAGLLCVRLFRRNKDNIPKNREPDAVFRSFIGDGGELQVFLDAVAKADDVPSYVKANPFGQPAITSEHLDWDFYSKILLSRQEDEELKFS